MPKVVYKVKSKKRKAPYELARRSMTESDRGYNISKRGAHHPSPMSSTTGNRSIISNSELARGQGADRPHPLSPWKVNDMCDYTTPENIRHEQNPQDLDDTSRNVSGVDTKTPDVITLDASEDGEDKFSPDDKWRSPRISPGERYEMGYDELALDNSPSQPSRSSVKLPRPINSVQDQGNLDVIKTTIKSFFGTAPHPSSFQAGSLQHPSQGVLDNAALNEKFREQSRELGKLSQVCVNLKEDNDELLCENQLMRVQGADLERQIGNLNHYQERKERELQAEILKLEAERDSSEEKYEALVRKQQEESFKQMSNGRWLPIEDTKVVSDLGRIKKEMRNWAKSTGVKGAEALENLSNSEVMSLLKNLSHVAVIKNNELPRGLSESKSPALLLNALLAHHLYTTMFRSPFFFLDNGLGEDSSLTRGAALLRSIYKLAQDSNKEDAHAWRSQTLRVLLPTLGTNTTEGERRLRTQTEKIIVAVSQTQASNFMEGSARHLLDPNKNNEGSKKKLEDIYHEAATLSYHLWTQRTDLKCFTLQELKRHTFDADSEYLTPHSLVRYDDYEDQLKGEPITLIVHPLLLAFGTDEGEDRDSGRIWASAEVWLDSRRMSEGLFSG